VYYNHSSPTAKHVADTASTCEAFRRSIEISDIKQTIQSLAHNIGDKQEQAIQ